MPEHLPSRVSADLDPDDMTDRGLRIARSLATSFNTAMVRVYSDDPLHLGVYDKAQSMENSKLMYLQFDCDMVVTQAKRRDCPEVAGEPPRDDRAYAEFKDRDHVAQFYTPRD